MTGRSKDEEDDAILESDVERHDEVEAPEAAVAGARRWIDAEKLDAHARFLIGDD